MGGAPRWPGGAASCRENFARLALCTYLLVSETVVRAGRSMLGE